MRTPHPYRNLSDAELAKLPRIDAVSQFSTDELRDAARMIMPAEEAMAYVNDLVALGPGAFMYGDILSALSLGSPRAARIVRDILGEDEEQERVRLSVFKERYPAAPQGVELVVPQDKNRNPRCRLNPGRHDTLAASTKRQMTVNDGSQRTTATRSKALRHGGLFRVRQSGRCAPTTIWRVVG